MKLKSLIVMLIGVCSFISCVEDDRTGIVGNPNCPLCNGKGYCEKSELLGLSKTYWDCFMCKNNSSGGYNPSFRGSQTGYTGECEICSCPAYDRSPDGICGCGHYKTIGYLSGSITHNPDFEMLKPALIKIMDEHVTKPDNFLVWSILTTVLCCVPTGIAAIVYANKVDTLWAMEKHQEAIEAAKNAKMWTFISLGLGLLWAAGVFFVTIIAMIMG